METLNNQDASLKIDPFDSGYGQQRCLFVIVRKLNFLEIQKLSP